MIILNELKSFFDGKTVMFTGAIGRWNGTHTGFDIGDFDDLFSKYTVDCDYFEIYDDDGALYIRCSHHDGTNLFQVLTLTNKGARALTTGSILTAIMQNLMIKRFINFY